MEDFKAIFFTLAWGVAYIRRFAHDFSNTLYYVKYRESKFNQAMLAQLFDHIGQNVCQFTNRNSR